VYAEVSPGGSLLVDDVTKREATAAAAETQAAGPGRSVGWCVVECRPLTSLVAGVRPE